MTPKGRTMVVALLVTVIGVRVSVSQPLTASVARIAGDPGVALRHAGQGWNLAGTLGGATAQGLREIPLASYYWLGQHVGVSAQALQTSWRVLVLLLALWGAIRLARVLAGPEHDESWAPWVAALLFSSGVVLVPTVVRSSLDGLAAATLPWVVAPLLSGKLGWRQAATSAAWLGLAGVGSPNWAAAALVAALVAAVPRSRDQVGPALRWLVLTAMSCAWWVSAYAWETGHARDVSALLGGDGLRGAVADALGRPDLATLIVVLVALGPLLVTASALLLRPPSAELPFIAALGGAALVVGSASLAGWDVPVFTSSATDRPASVLAPVLGWLGLTALVAWTPLVGLLGDRFRSPAGWRPPSGRQELTVGVVGLLVVLTTAAGAMAAGAEPEMPGDARARLATQIGRWSEGAPPGRVLVLPARVSDARAPSLGASLGDRPWVGRDSLPPSGVAATSTLDDLLGRLGRGDGGPGTSTELRRLGISYVLMHLEGSASVDRANPAALVRAALVAQGGRRVAHLSGPEGPRGETKTRRLLDFGVRDLEESVEIWSVPGAAYGWVYPGAPVEVVGAAGTPADLADAGVLGSRATRFRGESTSEVDVLSDSARRRDVDQRVPVDPYGPDLGPDEPRSVVPADAAPVTTASTRLSGARSVTASSSAADLDGLDRQAGTQALAAVDANVFTSWQSRRGTGRGEWWEIQLDGAAQLSGASVQFVRNSFAGRPVTRVEVLTDEGAEQYDVPEDGLLVLRGAGTSSRLRITVTAVDGSTEADDSVGIAEVTIPRVSVSDALGVTGPPPAAWLLAARTGSSTQCVPAAPSATEVAAGGPPTVCDRGVTVDGPDGGRLDRVIEVDRPVAVGGRAWLRAAATAESAALADRLARPTVVASGSSAAAQDLVTRPQAAVDDDTSTAWRPAPEDSEPTLTLGWPEPAEVSGLRLVLDDDGVASVPTHVRVAAEVRGKRTVSTEAAVDQDGTVTSPGVRTRQMTITFLEDSGLTSVGSVTGGVRPVPIAVAEVEVVGGPEIRYEEDQVRSLGCGSGPVVSIGGDAAWTEITTSAADVVAGSPVRADLCKDVDLPAGEVEVGVAPSYLWSPLGVVLAGSRSALLGLGRAEVDPPGAGPVAIAAPGLGRPRSEQPVAVRLDGSADEQTLALAVPAATGWEARTARGRLQSITVDGWAQAWVVPPGVELVELRYSAGGSLRAWVGLGAAAWFLVVVLVVVLAVLGSAVARRSGSRDPR